MNKETNMEIRIISLGNFTKIESSELEITIENVEKITLKKENNDKTVILVESKNQ